MAGPSLAGICFLILTVGAYFYRSRGINKRTPCKSFRHLQLHVDLVPVLITFPLAGPAINDAEEAGIAMLPIEPKYEQPIVVDDLLCTSRVSNVWLVKMDEKYLTAKTFALGEEPSKKRELVILNRLPSHENVIEFIREVMVDDSVRVQSALLTAHYPLGCLQRYLATHELDTGQLVQLATSLARGLAFLHKEGIVLGHIRSKCVLLAQDGDRMKCVFSDFSRALSQDHVPLHGPTSIDTNRYHAPELLAEDADWADFHLSGLIKCDVYSFALVVWEMASRTHFQSDTSDDGGEVGGLFLPAPYQQPYSDAIRASYPQMRQRTMRHVVVGLSTRPAVNEDWRKNAVMDKVGQIVVRCWSERPAERPELSQVLLELQPLKSSSNQQLSSP